MARGEVWNDNITLFRIGGVKVVEARLFVAQDDRKPLKSVLQMLVSFRILGAEVDNDTATNNFPVQSGPVRIPVSVSTFSGNIDATITDHQGFTQTGKSSSDPVWADVEQIHFTLSALGKVTIPVSDILAFVPGIGFILKGLLSALPSKQVSFTLGSVPVDVPIHRANGNVVLPAGAVVPTWWV